MSRVKRHKPKRSEQKKEHPKKGMSKQMIMTIIIGGLMVLSVFGIMFSSYNSESEEATYGDYVFKSTGSRWFIDINGKKAEFGYLPQDVEDIEVSQEVKDLLRSGKVLYVTFNPNTPNVQQFELMRFELANVMSHSGVYAMVGVSEENPQYKQPLVDCTNATSTVPVINIVESNSTKAYLDGNCIMLEADEFSAAPLKDRILYIILGIMD